MMTTAEGVLEILGVLRVAGADVQVDFPPTPVCRPPDGRSVAVA
jgi:hypothetical protein